VSRPRAGADALLAAVQELQGVPLPASVLESEILPARIRGYRPSDLDLLCAAGEVVWRGIEPLGAHDGRVALFLPDQHALLAPAPGRAEGELAGRVRELLASRGALFFADLVLATGAFARDLVGALWELVWAGEVTNDTLAPLRSLLGSSARKSDRRSPRRPERRARRLAVPGSEGRWSLAPGSSPGARLPSETERRTALANALLDRYGVVTREAVHAEGIAGGFSSVYEVLKAMEETGRIRRGYFVAGLGATQFARPGAEDRLRALREPAEPERTLVLAATDPASPYGAALPWPSSAGAEDADKSRPQRAAGALVVIGDGRLLAFLGRAEHALSTFLPVDDHARAEIRRRIADALGELVDSGRRKLLLVTSVDGAEPASSPLAPELLRAGFTPGARGWLRRPRERAVNTA
jgi:ATP-dependent helicase Lhr and Lhr-like helicase